MSLEEAQGFANEEPQGLTMLSPASELPTSSSRQLFSCCYGRSHSGALAGSMLSVAGLAVAASRGRHLSPWRKNQNKVTGRLVLGGFLWERRPAPIP